MKPFVIDDYGKKSTFASFLPGISGLHGIPLWSFYVNRGQCIASFGVDNKDDSIMEFSPAHQAYQCVKTTGFRTFIKKDGRVFEPFSDEDVPSKMEISMNMLELSEEDKEHGVRVHVSYYTLPGEELAALVRSVRIENISDEKTQLEVLDGMPALIPRGVPLDLIKDMGQTVKAWMQVEDSKERTPYYRVKASIEDSAEVQMVEDGNFALGWDENGGLLPVFVDPGVVFGYDSALRRAIGFEETPLADLFEKEQCVTGEFPCAFFGRSITLAGGESAVFNEMYGLVDSRERLHSFIGRIGDGTYFDRKREEASALTRELSRNVATKTASEEFDGYCAYNYMDNVLRGGYPILLGKDTVFYAYSRKHGDLERDYNFFSMLPEYYSQGNGNFRDVNQNRRCDTFFAPFVGRENIRKFYSLIQLDGYNPLSIEKMTFKLKDADELLAEVPCLEKFGDGKMFTPGEMFKALREDLPEDEAAKMLGRVMDHSESVLNEKFGEGYWSDHWTYNLDLVEEYLEVFPDREKELFYEEFLDTYLSRVNINHRSKRCVETKTGLRQYLALNEESRREPEDQVVRTREGGVLKMSLLEKLVLMCAVKFAALDAYGMGVEMEGGKPGWYDALNGLPGMFGSSMNEVYELGRMLEFTAAALKKHGQALPVLNEVKDLLTALDAVNRDERGALHALDEVTDAQTVYEKGQVLCFWNRINDIKEDYRDRTFEGVGGEKTLMEAGALADILEGFEDTLRSGIHKAEVLGGGIVPSYFAFDVPQYRVTEDGIIPEKFVPVSTPHFLEGSVRRLKMAGETEEKRAIYRAVKASDLYDIPLGMYKVNASLGKASYEFGRAVAFTPGWLENESVWMHMEYKYLLELLKSGLYEEFFEDFHKAAIPFLDPEVYGRSIYENSSFIVSSVFPNKALHGKGFVARLSGSTVEFISMWKRMFFGPHILTTEDGELSFKPQPALPAYLIPEDGAVSAELFGSVKVSYHFPEVKDYIPGKYTVKAMEFIYPDGESVKTQGPSAAGSIPYDLREGRIAEVHVTVD